MSLRKLTALSLFTTLALIIFTVESAIPPLVPIPGIKLGLANIITLVLLNHYTPKETFLVLLARILLCTFFFGQALSLLYSLAGGIACFCIMLLANRLLQGHFMFLTGILGALAHNTAQIAVAYWATATSSVLVYLPFLLLSAIITGFFTGLCAHFAQHYLKAVLPSFAE